MSPRPMLVAALAAFAMAAVSLPTAAHAQFAQDFASEDFNDGLVEVHDRVIVLNETILFFFDKAKIKPESGPLLNKLADTLKSQPGIQEVLIAGHTDSVGSERYNLALSGKRADAVREYLVEHGIAPRRLRTAALGEDQPRVPNTSEANRQINRRVEFQLTKTETDRRRLGGGVDVLAATGTVDVLTGAEQQRPAELHERLRAGVALETGPESALVLRLPDLSVLRMGASTRLKLARIGQGADGRLDVSVKLVCGSLAIYGRASTRAVVFTPVASVIGEDSVFTVTHGDGGRLQTRVLTRWVDVSAGGTAGKVEAGYADVVTADGSIAMPTPLLVGPQVIGGRYDGDAQDVPAWHSVPGAARYRVIFSEDPRSLRVTSAVMTTDGTVAPDPAARWWRVEAVDSLGVAGFGSTLHELPR